MFTVKRGAYSITGEGGKDPQDPYSGWWVVMWDTLRPRPDAPHTCVYATDKRCPKSLRGVVKRSRGRAKPSEK